MEMKTKIPTIFKEMSYWVKVFFYSLCTCFLIFLDTPWYIVGSVTMLSGIMIFILCSKNNILKIKLKSVFKSAQKNKDAISIYNFIDKEFLPKMRGELPTKIYKYFQLGNDEHSDLRRINTVKNNSIWASIYSEFNDPFECQYMYLTEDDFKDNPFPKVGKDFWDSIIGEIRQRMTTICFTQNPDNMSMWAHYANDHKGFCVEYEVVDNCHLYPVVYTEKRLKSLSLFIELVYSLFCEKSESGDSVSVLKHIMLLSAFKDKSWEQEKEIR